MKKAVILMTAAFCLCGTVFAAKGKKIESDQSTAKPGEGGGAAIKAFGEKIGDGLTKGFEKLGEKIDEVSDEAAKRELIDAKGKVKVKGKDESLTITLIDEKTKKTYILKTASGTPQSMKKLALCKGHLVSVSGIYNTDTNIISVMGYEILDEAQ